MSNYSLSAKKGPYAPSDSSSSPDETKPILRTFRGFAADNYLAQYSANSGGPSRRNIYDDRYAPDSQSQRETSRKVNHAGFEEVPLGSAVDPDSSFHLPQHPPTNEQNHDVQHNHSDSESAVFDIDGARERRTRSNPYGLTEEELKDEDVRKEILSKGTWWAVIKDLWRAFLRLWTSGGTPSGRLEVPEDR